MNLYGYVKGNPVRFSDPSGRDGSDIILDLQRGLDEGANNQWKQAKQDFSSGSALGLLKGSWNTYAASVNKVTAFILPLSKDEMFVAAMTMGLAPAAGKSMNYLLNRGESLLSKMAIKGGTNKALGFVDKVITKDQFYESAMKIAKTGNFQAGKDSAIFYSGQGIMGKATNFAERTGKKTIELTDAGSVLDKMHLYKNLGPDLADKIWKEASTNYAKSAEGIVHKFIQGHQQGRVYQSIEKPILKNNSKVTGSKSHY